jgi:hypothetical protein
MNAEREWREERMGTAKRSHFCRGCGQELPTGCHRHFHKQCLQADKRGRILEQRQREQVRFQQRLKKHRCPNCGARYGDQQPEANVNTRCEASQASQERDPPFG